MAESLGSRSQNHHTTFVQQSVLLLRRENFIVNLDLGRNRRRNRVLSNQTCILQQVEFRKLRLQNIILFLDLRLCLQNRTWVPPRILSNRNECLVIIRKLRRDLVNAGPPNLLHRASPICKELLRLMRLDPDLIQVLCQRLPVLERPLGIRDPDVATCLRKESRIQNFQKHIYFGFLTLRIGVGNLTKLDIVFTENVGDNSHEKSCILHEPRASIDNEIDSHVLLQVAFCRPLSARGLTTGPRTRVQLLVTSSPRFGADFGTLQSHPAVAPPNHPLADGGIAFRNGIQLFCPLCRQF